jgi:HSP20 family molecular chaperone IbpA
MGPLDSSNDKLGEMKMNWIYILDEMLNEFEEASRTISKPIQRREMQRPYTEDEESIYITVDVPGVKKDDIDVQVRSHSDAPVLCVSADGNGRKYKREILLPSNACLTKPKATFVNGVLDITFEKKEKTPVEGITISVE